MNEGGSKNIWTGRAVEDGRTRLSLINRGRVRAEIAVTQDGVRMTSGARAKSAFDLSENLKYDKNKVFSKWRKHVLMQDDFNGNMSRKNYLRAARNIYNNPNTHVVNYPQNYGGLYPGETHFILNGFLLRLAPDGSFRSFYPKP